MDVFPLLSPSGAPLEVNGRERRDVLLSRGYREFDYPDPPEPTNEPGILTADVVLAPWDERRITNIETYDIPGLGVVPDVARQGCWPTVRRAWLNGLTQESTHHLVLTDDLTLPKGFWLAANKAITLFPESPISLFTVMKGARAARGHWCVSWGFTGAANILPTHMIGPFLQWEERNVRSGCPHDDIRLTAWATDQRIPVLTPVPCLVNHGTLPSVVKDTVGKLHSEASVYQDDVTGVDWNEGADEPYFIGVSVASPAKWLL